ncbi:HNH endonuclease [Limnobacter sp.]|uniref:HNH endonuclease n=1 Tax=Limnobacter sp. TaxID=2003368 RepID=UPI0027333C49|nr:HNH endonuclease [Limnobacter sp.]MDP3271307.1 HNH endonuclease [Limnobacter sp.]
MPISPARPCSHPGCKALVRDGSGRCEAHRRKAWAKRPDAAKRITGRRLQALRVALFEREPLCAECKRNGVVRLATQRDHIQSLEEGGAEDEDNTQGLCDECHEGKSLKERLKASRQGRGV